MRLKIAILSILTTVVLVTLLMVWGPVGRNAVGINGLYHRDQAIYDDIQKLKKRVDYTQDVSFSRLTYLEEEIQRTRFMIELELNKGASLEREGP